MLKYLVVLLDDMSTAYCHYENEKKVSKLISLEDLKAGILFAMKENLIVQFVYPKYELPQEYHNIINTIHHCKIIPMGNKEKGDVIVLNGWGDFIDCTFEEDITYVFRITKDAFFTNSSQIKEILGKTTRLNIIITDVGRFTDEDFNKYMDCLQVLNKELEKLYVNGKTPQLNLLTDRMMLTAMNNCNAGWENITLAPDGKFYVCPAFYQADSKITIEEKVPYVGDLRTGVDIKNPQLYKLNYAPLCRDCDAYQCKRCIWLNRKMTMEVNTPSHEQCVVAHLERNASRDLLTSIRKQKEFMPNMNIVEVDYLDPLDTRKNSNY